MVLDRSDYNLSNLYRGNFDPTNPMNFVGKVLGGIFVLSVVLYLWNFANNRGYPTFNALMSRVSGGRASAEGGQIEVF